MHILHLISGLNSGGAESVLFKLIKNDNDNKHNVISFSEGFYLSELKKNKIDVNIIKLNNIFFIINIIRLIFLIKKKNPDIIQSWMYHADFITIFLKLFFIKKKFFWNIRNTTPRLEWSGLLTIIFGKICALFSYIVPNRIISCSKTALIEHSNFGYCKKKFKLIFNGFDSNTFKPNLKNRKLNRKKLKIDDDDFVIGCFARYHPQKNHKTLIVSFENFFTKYNKSKLLLIGENLPKILSKKNKNIIILSPTKKINEMYNVIDLFILPSIGYEGFPNVLAEAMLSKVYCLATNVGDSKRILGKYGKIFKKKNPKDLTKKIFEFIKKRNSLSKINSRDYVIQNFGINEMVRQYNVLWNSR